MSYPQKNYTLGRGELYFGAFKPNTRIPDGQIYIGNTTEISLTTETESLDHYDSDHGIRVKDDSVLLEKNTTGSFTTDHISPDNLARLFLGTSGVVTQASATAQVANIDGVKKGRRYQLGVTSNRPYGVRGITNVTVAATPAGGASVNLILGTDYTVDAETGAILFLSSGLILTNDADDDVVATYDVQAASYNQVVSGSEGSLEGELFYKSFNPKGDKFDYLFPFVQLKPSGDFSLKGDEWQQITFEFEALKKGDGIETVYTNGRPGINV